jgi:hypothetical protein
MKIAALTMKARRGTLGYHAERLNDTTWLTVFGYAWAIFSTTAMLLLVTPMAWRAPIKIVGFALPLLLFVVKDLAQLPDVLVRLRALRGRRSRPSEWLVACLPPGLVGWMRLERALWSGCFGWLHRRPRVARPSGLSLTYDQQGAYPAVTALALFSILVEMPISAAIMPLFIKDPAEMKVIHCLLVLGSLYSLVWVLGDRWLVRGSHHVLTEHYLDLRVGARASASIALDAIEDAQLLREAVRDWRKEHPHRSAEAVSVTPFDQPNLILRLDVNAGCYITHHGVTRCGVRYLFLYLDRPEHLLAALTARRTGQA